jgi:Protein of unknown function (DUF2806)
MSDTTTVSPLRRRMIEDMAARKLKQLIEGLTKLALDRITTDHEFAERVLRNHFGIAFDRQANKDGVMRHAIEDLRRDPTADDAGPELDPLFVNRLERHAEDASTEDLREKWGRVLAVEIRKPGTISARVMRIVDELDADTARLFERLCSSRIGSAVPICLHGKLNFRQATSLEAADLVVDPFDSGHLQPFAAETINGREVWFVSFGSCAFSFPRDAPLQVLGENNLPLFVLHDRSPAIPLYLLTEAGRAVSRILPDDELATFERYLGKLRSLVPDLPITIYRPIGTDSWEPVEPSVR